MFARLAYVALRTPPMPYRLLNLAEDCAYSGKNMSVEIVAGITGLSVDEVNQIAAGLAN
jgi:hypothetical protein